jgi:hypothetical protein
MEWIKFLDRQPDDQQQCIIVSCHNRMYFGPVLFHQGPEPGTGVWADPLSLTEVAMIFQPLDYPYWIPASKLPPVPDDLKPPQPVGKFA